MNSKKIFTSFFYLLKILFMSLAASVEFEI